MAVTRIVLWLGHSFVLCAALMVVTAMTGLILLEIPQAITFAVLAFVTGLVGAIFIISTLNTPARETNTDALVFLLLFWLIVPVVLSVPFMTSGAISSLSTAYFESVSALTTTGASTFDPDGLSQTIRFWRSLMQWMGGVSAATFAVVILAALNLTGTGVHRSMLFTLKKGELFERLVGIGSIIAGIYAGISAVCFIGLLISGTPIFESLCLSLSAVSTGGLTPRSGPLENYVSSFGAIILAVTCFLGAANIAIVWDVLRLRTKAAFKGLGRNVEHRAMVSIIAILIIAGLAVIGPDHIKTIILEAVFFVSSTGFDYDVFGVEMLPESALITIALIGGSALSTAGGVKLIRLLLLFRHLSTDLSRLTHPSRVVPVKFRGQILPDRAFLSIWMYFFAYTLVFAFATMALGATGLDYVTATSAGAAALANMGPLLDWTLPQQSYPDFTSLQLTVLSMIMLIGRIEVLAAFAFITPAMWQQ